MLLKSCEPFQILRVVGREGEEARRRGRVDDAKIALWPFRDAAPFVSEEV